MKRQEVLTELEAALGKKQVKKLEAESATRDGSQYRASMVEEPSRQEILKKMQQEEQAMYHEDNMLPGESSQAAHLTASLGINISLDLEIKQWVPVSGF